MKIASFFFALALAVSVTSPVVAQTYQPSYGSTYDQQSGNTYTWSRDSTGNTNLNGYNLSTGSMWRQTIQPNGNQSGLDSNGNYWNYNAGTKTYMNYGTGKYCVNGICN